MLPSLSQPAFTLCCGEVCDVAPTLCERLVKFTYIRVELAFAFSSKTCRIWLINALHINSTKNKLSQIKSDIFQVFLVCQLFLGRIFFNVLLRDIGVCSKIPLYRIGAWTILSYNSNTIRMAMLLHTAIYLGIHENGKFTGCRKWDMAFVMMWACGYSRLEVGADREKGPTPQTQVVRCIVEYCRDHTGTLVWSMTSSVSRTR